MIISALIPFVLLTKSGLGQMGEELFFRGIVHLSFAKSIGKKKSPKRYFSNKKRYLCDNYINDKTYMR
jgi:hypothetical protein